MYNFSGTQQLERKDRGEAPFSAFGYMKKTSQALRIQELEEENELLKSDILQLHMMTPATSKNVAGRDRVAEMKRIAEREKEKCETAEIVARLTSKINALCDIFNGDYLKFNKMVDRLKFLEENYEPCVKRAFEKAKLARKELKEKEGTYETLLKEMRETICKLEQENKEKHISEKEFKEKFWQLKQEIKDKAGTIAEISNKNISEFGTPKSVLIRRSPPQSNDDDDFSSFTTCCDEAFETRTQTQKTFKYCGRREEFAMNKGPTYRHLRKTRTSVKFTDTESINDVKRQRIDNY